MRLGEMLIKAGVINELQLNAAVAEQQRWGGRLGGILVRMGALSEDLLVLALCRQLALPKADLDSIQNVPEALKQRLDQAACERYHVLPIAYVAERRAVQLAMADPFDVVALDDLTRMLGTKLEAFLAGDQALAAAIRRLYGATSTGELGGGMNLEFIDNGGNRRPETGLPRAAAPTAPPQPVPAPPQQASFAARVDEQARAVRAVAELLSERGHISVPRR